MSKTYRIWIASLLVAFLFTQFMGAVGGIFGVDGPSVTYTGWAGYLMTVGICTLAIIFVLAIGLASILLMKWIEKGKSNESNKTNFTDPSLREDGTSPSTHIRTVVRSGSPNNVPSEMSRRTNKEISRS